MDIGRDRGNPRPGDSRPNVPPFCSSARRGRVRFHHWVRANVEYADCPYSRFDVAPEPLTYTGDN